MLWSKLRRIDIDENEQIEDQVNIWGKIADLYPVVYVAQFCGGNTNVQGPINNGGDMTPSS